MIETMKLTILAVLVINCTLIQVTLQWRIYHHGRGVGGNMGAPLTTDSAATRHHVEYNPDADEEHWFEQILDHFTPTDERKWKQRYFVNEQFYNRTPNDMGPIFLSVGGEGEINSTWMHEGAWIDYAIQQGALCFQLEHRYYGKSRPTVDMSTKNLQYLSSNQALADLATFIEAMNIKYGFVNPKWIAFGGSYPGSLAAWLRYKYPHLVVGAMSASGPLLAKLDFYEYFGVVESALRTTKNGDECVDAVLAGTQQLDTLLKHRVGQLAVDKKFKLCDPIERLINNELDVSNLYETLSGNFAGVVQYNRDNRVNGKHPMAAQITIDTLCDIMVNDSLGVELNRLAAVNTLLLTAYNQTCLDYKYQTMVDTLRNASWSSAAADGMRQWTYQTCTEFGFYQTSAHKPQLFGNKFPVDFFVRQCMDVFGPKYNYKFISSKVDLTNVYNGGLDLDVSNVVFVHGTIDPWHALGITTTRSNKAPAILINGTAHCANMYPAAASDPPQLKQARVQVGQLIDSWIRLG